MGTIKDCRLKTKAKYVVFCPTGVSGENRSSKKGQNMNISNVMFHSLSEADGLSWKSGTNSALSL